jgi:hypothetical protein
MLFFIFGSLASGKSTLLRQVEGEALDLVVVEDDVPRPARTKAERQRLLERRLAEIRSAEGDHDVLYAGQSPLDELLACPVATEFAGIAPCLIDCSDPVRIERLQSRGWPNTIPELDMLGWAEWMRRHAQDPQHEQPVLLDGGASELRWDRWNRWRRGDPRWQVTVIDNTGDEPAATLARLIEWISSQRRLMTAGALPLAEGWESVGPT